MGIFKPAQPQYNYVLVQNITIVYVKTLEYLTKYS